MQLDCSCGRILCSPCTLTVGSAVRRHRQSISTAELRGPTDVLSDRNDFSRYAWAGLSPAQHPPAR
eukprot:5682251-Prymnesium_polylepis.1